MTPVFFLYFLLISLQSFHQEDNSLIESYKMETYLPTFARYHSYFSSMHWVQNKLSFYFFFFFFHQRTMYIKTRANRMDKGCASIEKLSQKTLC